MGAPLTNLLTQHVAVALVPIYHVHSFMHVKEKSDVVTSLPNVQTDDDDDYIGPVDQ